MNDIDRYAMTRFNTAKRAGDQRRMLVCWAAFHRHADWMHDGGGNGGPWSSDWHRGVAFGRMSSMVLLDEARVRETKLRAEVERLRLELATVQGAGVNLACVTSRLHEACTVALGWLDVKEPEISRKALLDALTREDGEG